MHEFVDGLAETGGIIPSARIRAWIEMCRASNEGLVAQATDPECMLESA
jgi:hypothetical protein